MPRFIIDGRKRAVAFELSFTHVRKDEIEDEEEFVSVTGGRFERADSEEDDEPGEEDFHFGFCLPPASG